MEKNASFDLKTLIVGILTFLIVGYIVGQMGGPHEEIERLRAERSELRDTLLQYRDACFVLKDQLENVTTRLSHLQHSHAELKGEYDELNAKYLNMVEDVKFKFFTFSNLTITPKVVDLADNVTISFYITNLLRVPSEYSYATHVEGPGYGYDIMDGISLGGYETKKISYTVTPEAYGDYTVSIDRLAGCFEARMVVS